jgi:hypothetical protein
MAVGFTTASYAISAYQFEFRPGVVFLIQHYVIQSVTFDMSAVFSTNKIDRHDIAEKLLKVALNTLTLTF